MEARAEALATSTSEWPLTAEHRCPTPAARPTLEAAPRASPTDDDPGDKLRWLRPPADCVNIGSPEALRRVAELEVEWMLGA
jgi:hypothetical protein